MHEYIQDVLLQVQGKIGELEIDSLAYFPRHVEENGKKFIINENGYFEGGMATVHKGVLFGFPVALKIMKQFFGSESIESQIEFAKRELEINQTLINGPNIVPIIEGGTIDAYSREVYFQIFPWYESNLDEMIGKDVSLNQVLSAGVGISSALKYAHMRKVVHRDVNPTNCYVDENGQVRLGDFGIADYSEVEEPAMIGTEGFAPGEQYVGICSYSNDITAFGISLIGLLLRQDTRSLEKKLDPSTKKADSFFGDPSHNNLVDEFGGIDAFKETLTKLYGDHPQVWGKIIDLLQYSIGGHYKDRNDINPVYRKMVEIRKLV